MFISVIVSWRLLLHAGAPYQEEAHKIASIYTLAWFHDRRLHIPGASPTAHAFSITETSPSTLVFLSMDLLAIPA
jgi:hypothetical protein